MTGACSFGRAGGALERRSSSDGPPRRQGRRPRRACMGKGVGPPFEPRTAENDARVPSPTVGFPGELFRRARAPRAPPVISRGKCPRVCAPGRRRIARGQPAPAIRVAVFFVAGFSRPRPRRFGLFLATIDGAEGVAAFAPSRARVRERAERSRRTSTRLSREVRVDRRSTTERDARAHAAINVSLEREGQRAHVGARPRGSGGWHGRPHRRAPGRHAEDSHSGERRRGARDGVLDLQPRGPARAVPRHLRPHGGVRSHQRRGVLDEHRGDALSPRPPLGWRRRRSLPGRRSPGVVGPARSSRTPGSSASWAAARRG